MTWLIFSVISNVHAFERDGKQKSKIIACQSEREEEHDIGETRTITQREIVIRMKMNNLYPLN